MTHSETIFIQNLVTLKSKSAFCLTLTANVNCRSFQSPTDGAKRWRILKENINVAPNEMLNFKTKATSLSVE